MENNYNRRPLITLMLLLISSIMVANQSVTAFSLSPFHPYQQQTGIKSTTTTSTTTEFSSQSSMKSTSLKMGLFDGFSKAFSNQEFKADDQRVRASHILIKGDDISSVLAKINQLMGELNQRVQIENENSTTNTNMLQPIFSDIARRESQCASNTQGGDLGMFGPGKMVKEFDDVLFPEGEGVVPPPVGSILGPVVTEFGIHVILVTKREENRDQVEEKLARND